MFHSKAVDDVTISAPQLGKTETARLWLFSKAWQHGPDPRPWWWTAPSYAQAKHGYLGLVRFARQTGTLDAATATPPFELRTTFGAVIQALSWDRPENMYGPSVLGGVSDEFGWMTDAAYSAISSRRAETIVQGFGMWKWIGNVGTIGGAAERLWNLAQSGAQGFACRRWTWRDRARAWDCACGNGKEIPIEVGTADQHRAGCNRGSYVMFVQGEAERMSTPQFRTLYEAEWVDWNDLPAYTFDREKNVNADRAAYDPHLPVELACDFNVDPMVWEIGQHRGDEVWTCDEIAIDGHATTEAACREFIRRHPNPKTEVVVYGDRSGKSKHTKSKQSDYKIMREVLGGHYLRLRFDVPKANPPVSDRLNAVNAKLCSGGGTVRYWIHPRCTRLIEDRARVSLLPGTRDIDKRDKKRTHASDADDYRIHRLFPIKLKAPVLISGASLGHDNMASMGW